MNDMTQCQHPDPNPEIEKLLSALRTERAARKKADARAKAAESRVKELRRFLTKLGDSLEATLTDIDTQATKRGTSA